MPFSRLFKHKDKNTALPPTTASSSKSTPFPSGLTTLADGVDPAIDIVAVHGLNGHRENTWTVNGINWLRDFLPLNIENARILSWGYDANTHSSSQTSFQHLYDHAKNLVADLCLERRLTKSETRPIIFVAHSLGGIVVKSALIHSDAARQGALEKHRSIKLSTYGILFMGTPHQGGNGVPLGKLMLNVASIFVAADDRILKHLERDSEWLQQQLGQYGPISGNFVTKFAYEIYPTPIALGKVMMIVPQASAIVPGAIDAEAIAIPANHLNMVKFVSREDEGYRKISGHLRLLAEEAPVVIKQRWREDDSVKKVPASSKEDFSIRFGLVGAPDIDQPFVGRKIELTGIQMALQGDEFQRKVVCLHGLGGIGKTQLAIEFAKRHQHDYTAAFWLNGKDEDTLKKSFADNAKRLPDANWSSNPQDKDADHIVEIIKKWLSLKGNTRWIMIFDNVDNPKLLDFKDPLAYDVGSYFPYANHGSILITTRSSRLSIGKRLFVKKFENAQESIEVLNAASQRIFSDQDPSARELIQELDGLPLALATTGTYLRHVTTSLQDYFRYYHNSWLQLQKTTPNLLSYEHALYTTWNISLEYIQAQNILAVKLLRLWAYFDHQDLWYQLLAAGYYEAPEWFSELVEDELNFNAAIRLLCDHALVERLKDSDGYGMHTCVHAWVIHVLNPEQDIEMASIALICVGNSVPYKNDTEQWKTGRRLLSHARQCSINIIDRTDIEVRVNENTLKAIFRLGNLYYDHAKLKESEKMFLRALAGQKEILGAEHIDTFGTTRNLGMLYTKQKKLKEAEEMLLRALTGFEKIRGPEHVETLQTINNLGNCYTVQKNWEIAEQMYLRAWTGFEKIRGAGHIETLGIINNLGVCYTNQNNLKKAEQMYLRALTGYEKAWGAETPMPAMLDIIFNLADLYSIEEGNLKRAEELYLRALKGYERVLGSEHEKSLETRNNLALTYQKQSMFEDTTKHYELALQGYIDQLGPGHKLSLDTRYNLALTYEQRFMFEDAAKHYELALQGYKTLLGPKHPETVDASNRLKEMTNMSSKGKERLPLRSNT